jgi:sortase (surface protein transpeptidase)
MRRSPSATRRVGGGRRRRSPWRIAALLLVAVLATGGSGLLVAALTAEPPRPPQPAADAAPPELYRPQRTVADADEEAGSSALAMRRSVPVRIRIPAIDVDAKLISLGVDDQGEVQVPSLKRAMDAGWYEHGPTPGEIGNAVVIGHVDSYKIGPAVFFKLGKLEPGDTIEVVRIDRSVATFRVDGVQSFPKDEFPAELVYGPSDRPSLRVVTCGGAYDKKTRNYRDNVIVFATLDT